MLKRSALGKPSVLVSGILVLVCALGAVAVVAARSPDRSTDFDASTPRQLGSRVGEATVQWSGTTSYEPALFAYDETQNLQSALFTELLARRAVAAEARRVAVAAEGEAKARRFPSDEWWYRIGRCEQPDGNGGVAWKTHGTNATTGVWFVGGLGIMEAAWNQYNVYGFPPGWRATPEQQMTIARDIYARAGAGAWSCSKTAGPAY